MREEVISTILGYSSIACWLGAQFPQIVVNWRRKSVDGLALPFLINWLFGDVTNLIGCILTNQLPFQTYVAIYFVSVDLCLVTQYFRYDASKDVKAISALRSQSRSSLVRSPSISYSPPPYTLPHTSLSRSRSRSYSMDPHLRAAVANVSLATAELEARYADPRTSDIESHSRWRSSAISHPGSLDILPENAASERGRAKRRDRRVSDADDPALDLECETPSLMIESFHSEGGGRGHKGEKRVSWEAIGGSRRRSNETPRQESSSTIPSTVRGRPLTRSGSFDAFDAPTDDVSSPTVQRRHPSSTSLVTSAASRRSAGIVFMGVFALIGLGTRVEYNTRRDVSVQGRVLGTSTMLMPFEPSSADIPPPSSVSVKFATSERLHASSDGETQLLIGRISAWTCATLYITSRLPQIWKNYVRKSVEGLSMYLFIFAFLGNFFYVLSILTSPKLDLPAAEARKFLRASIPYLLGSGGTLVFDVTIVLQSLVYGNRAPRNTRHKRKSTVTNGEEERALLEAELDP